MRSNTTSKTISLLVVTSRLLFSAHAWTTTSIPTRPTTVRAATVAPVEPSASSVDNNPYKPTVLQTIEAMQDEATQYAEMFGLEASEAAFYALFSALAHTVPFGVPGQPVHLVKDEIAKALGGDNKNSPFAGYFTMKDLEKALEDDFLDAARGSTDNRQGWKVRGWPGSGVAGVVWHGSKHTSHCSTTTRGLINNVSV